MTEQALKEQRLSNMRWLIDTRTKQVAIINTENVKLKKTLKTQKIVIYSLIIIILWLLF